MCSSRRLSCVADQFIRSIGLTDRQADDATKTSIKKKMTDAKTVHKGKSAADLLAASTGISAPSAASKPKPSLLAVDAKAEADLKGMSLRSGVHESVKALSELLHLCKVSEAEWSGHHENQLHVILCRKVRARAAAPTDRSTQRWTVMD